MHMAPQEKEKSVLLLDDDKFLVEMYAMKFKQYGYNVMSALSVDEALGDLRGGFQPDIILLDLVMPEKDGLTFLAAINAEKLAPRASKIVLTNQYDDAERQKTLELGADKCVVKASIVPSEVVRMVEELLASKHKK